VGDLEVDQQAEREFRELEVRQQLGAVHGQDLFDSFDFDDDAVLDNEIDPIGRRKFYPVVFDGELSLATKLQASIFSS
jgi:hypothetical protein